MGWWGKIAGGAFGFMLGGPLGALLGAVLGHNLDRGLKGLEDDEQFAPGDRERIQTAFFTATFSIMGHLAKADGRVSKDEIALAQSVMAQMELDAQMRRAAISIPSNIAEGFVRKYAKVFKNTISIAIGSLAELDTQIMLSTQLGFTSKSDSDALLERTEVLGKKMTNFYKGIETR